jgi:hypothetical protein
MPDGKKPGNIPVLSAIIGALCIILYIGALSYGALNIYNNVTERRALGDRECDGLANLASAAGALGFMDEKFIQTIQDAIDGSETILGVVISGSKGEFAFERERGTVISWVNNSPRFVPRFGVTRPPYSLPLRIEGQRNVNIQAVSGYLDYDFCIGILKRTLLIILFSLTLAFFTLLMDSLLTKNTANTEGAGSPADLSAGSSGSSPGNSPAPGAYGPVKKAAEPKAEPKKESVPETERSVPEAGRSVPEAGGEKTGETDWNVENFDFEDEDDFPDFEEEEASEREESPELEETQELEESPGPEETQELEESPAPAAEDPPRGLFSPRGNVGWESYVKERLESELRRSAAGEQDLTLIVMAFKEPEKLSGEQFRCFAEEAALYFEHRDLIFEHGERGLWVIHPNRGLEQDIGASEEFNNRILTRLPRPESSQVDLRFGISSRSGRLVSAEQIMLEAGEALKRATEDPLSHIVAFKSDPEKYRQYISGRNLRSA